MITVKCPECEGITLVGVDSLEEAEGSTADCGHCSTELIFDGGQIKGLHEHLNKSNPAWPVDGKGVGCMTTSMEHICVKENNDGHG